MMTKGSVWIMLICLHVHLVSSQTPDELLRALKQQYSQQPDCTPMFEIRHPGYISSRATDYPSITTDAGCRSSCTMDENCMSYQIDLRPGQTFCRMQPSYSIDELNGPYSATDVKEYVFTVKCINSTIKGQCAPLIEIRLRNWNSHYATEQQVTSEMECRAICFADQDCMSYQIDIRPPIHLCYTQKHLEKFKKSELYMSTEIREYLVVDRCLDKYDVTPNKACSPVFKKLFRPREVSQMATPNPFITTEQLCRLRCLFDPDCVSYQINRNPEAPFCLVQTDVRNLMQEKLIKADLVTDYILVNPCTNRPFDKSAPGCIPFEFPKPYTGISYLAEPHAEVTRYNECRSLCLVTPTCVSYQNSTMIPGKLCWLLHDWKHVMPNNAFTTREANEYVIARKCSQEPAAKALGMPDFEVNTPETVLDECMPSDMRSESDIIFAISFAGILKRHANSEQRLRTIKSFLSNIVVSLNVASSKDRIALVTFESRAYVEFNLNTYNDPKLITEAVAKIGCHECNATEAGVIPALNTIMARVLTNPAGSRYNVPHVIILITDRLSTVDPEAIISRVRDLARADTYIIPIGVTDTVEGDKLKGFATPNSDGTEPKLLWVNNFASLNTLVYRVHDAILQVLPKKFLRLCLK